MCRYSTAWLARAVPDDGKVTTLELNPHHVKVATENLTDAGLIHKVDIILGPASETLENLSPSPAPFDMVFIDADKEGNVAYYNHAKRLLRKGGIIVRCFLFPTFRWNTVSLTFVIPRSSTMSYSVAGYQT